MLEKLIHGLCDDFDIVVYSHATPNGDYRNDKFRLRFPPRSLKGHYLRWLFLSCYFFTDYWKKKFDLVIAFWGYPTGFFVSLFSKILGIPGVVSVLGADSASIRSINYGIFHNRFQRLIATWSYSSATALLAISDFQRKKLIGFGIDRVILTIPWGADASMYRFSKRNVNAPINFIHVGHINPVKDQATLLKAFALIRRKIHSTLSLYGLDTMNGTMHQLCVDLGISDSVKFLDMVPYHEMPQRYQDADIMLHSSLSEGQCMALTEAAACGVLMAGTNVGILHDLGEECGIVVELGDYEGLAAKVIDLIGNPNEWARRVENARKWSEAHDMNWTVKELSLLFRRLGTIREPFLDQSGPISET